MLGVCACGIRKADRMKPIKRNRSDFNWCSLVSGQWGPICIVSRATSVFLYILAQRQGARETGKNRGRGRWWKECGHREERKEQEKGRVHSG